MTSHDWRDAPPVARPEPIVVATVPPPETTAAHTVARRVPPPKEGPTGGGTTPTGVDVGLPTRRRPGTCAMMHRTLGADLPGLALLIWSRRSPRANASADGRESGRQRPSSLLGPRTGRKPRPLRVHRRRQALWPAANRGHSLPGVGTHERPKRGVQGRPKPPRVSRVRWMPPLGEQSRPRSSTAAGMRPPSYICSASMGAHMATWRTALCGWMER